MAVNTKWTTSQATLTIPQNTPGVSGQIVISAPNAAGYYSGVFKLSAFDPTDSIVKLSLTWRPNMMTGFDHTRRIPTYVDLASDGVPQNIALVRELRCAASNETIITDQYYYFYLINPQTPVAAPLLVDEPQNRLGLTLIVTLERVDGNNEIGITTDLAFGYVEMT